MAALILLRYRHRRAIRRNRIFRDRINPLDKYDDVDLYRKFRFRRGDIFELTDEIADDITQVHRQGALSPALQVCLTLRFYASGSFQDVCAELVGVSQPTVSRVINRVTNAILQHFPQWVRLPTPAEAEITKANVYRSHHLPNVFGFIDGTHVRIQAPTIMEHEYVNRKNYHSINVQVICDSDMLFINVIAKWPGSVHDARMLRTSSLFDAFEGNNKPLTGFLLADSAYMLRDWLLTPIGEPETRQERNYNFQHSSARSTVERSIGVAKRRWHCLRTGLRVAPDKACKIICVCLMLHNRARMLRLADPDSDEDSDSEDEDPDLPDQQDDAICNANMNERARTAAGRAARTRVVTNYC